MKRLNLRLFDEGGGAQPAESQTTETGIKYQSKHVKSNGLENVKYGIQADGKDESSAEAENEPATEPEERPKFADLIKGEYKKDFDEKVQSIIDERFKKTKGLEEKLNNINPIISKLAAKYGVKSEDVNGLMAAIDADKAYYEVEAEKLGISVEQLKNMRDMEADRIQFAREKEEVRLQMEEFQKQRRSEEIWGKWKQEAEEVKNMFPDFELETELQNPQFQALLTNGVDMNTAYKVLHMDDVIGSAMQYTAAQVAQKQAANIAKKAQRPIENGTSSQGGVVVKKDVSKLSREDRREIIRRVSRGEQISF
ncbi:MAG: hypothetical protein ACOCNC_11430 [Acetivibrio ethanolgignens]